MKNSYWITSGILTFLEKFSTLFFGFGSFYLLIRIVSKEEFGVWALFLSVTTILEMARNGLIQNAVIRYLSSTPASDHKAVMSASFALNCILTGLSSILLFLLSTVLADLWHAPGLVSMFRFYILTTIALIPLSQFNFIQQANLDFKGIFVSNFARQIAFFGYILYFFLFAKTDITLLKVVNFQTVAAILGSISAYFFSRKYLKLTFSIDFDWIKKLFHYGKFVFGTNISSTLFKSGDQMLLGYLVNPAGVALYNLSARIVNLFDVPVTSIASIVFPQSSKRIHEEGIQVAKLLYEKSVAVMLCLLLPGIVFVFVFAKYIIILIAGPKYLDATWILQLTLLQVFFMPFARQFGTILDSIGKPHINFYTILVSIFLNLSLNYFFINAFGVVGTAYGALLMAVIGFIFSQIYLRKTLNISTLAAFRYIVFYYVLFFNKVKELIEKIRK